MKLITSAHRSEYTNRTGLFRMLFGDDQEKTDDSASDNSEDSKENLNEPETEPETPLPIEELPESVIENLKKQENVWYAIGGGLGIAMICALIWAVITYTVEAQIGFMAIGVGFAVGFGVRFLGAGISSKFGIIAAALALFGCVFGNLLAFVAFGAKEVGLSFWEAFQLLNMDIIGLMFSESFEAIDLLFYGFALYEGFRFGTRALTKDDVEAISSDASAAIPENDKMRLPATIGLGIIGVVILGITINTIFLSDHEFSGEQESYYDNGNIMSRGVVENNLEQGPWTYYYENGNKNIEGSYENGIMVGEWNNYYLNGQLSEKLTYTAGLKNGPYEAYYEDGTLASEGFYKDDRLSGEWTFYHENGEVREELSYVRDHIQGEYKTYSEDGILVQKLMYDDSERHGIGYFFFPNGDSMVVQNAHHDTLSTIRAWDNNGNLTVNNGNGLFKVYYDSGEINEKGAITNGYRSGIWTAYYPNGDKQSEILEDNLKSYILNSWDMSGNPMVENGNGYYTSYYESENIYEEGAVKDSVRTNTWIMYYDSAGIKMSETMYENGKLNGVSKNFHDDGSLALQATMEDGKTVGKVQWYYRDGTLSAAADYVADKKHGIQSFYNTFGALIKEEEWKNGEFVASFNPNAK